MSLKVIIVRHALAEDKEIFKKTGLPDSARPLLPRGIRDIEKMAKILKKIEPHIDIIGVSPYVRAQQTADHLHKVFRRARRFEMQELTPQTAAIKTLRSLQKIGRAGTVALVGHEPHLSKFLSFVLTGSSRPIFDIKKGGVALLEFRGRVDKKQAVLKCFLQPSQAKKIRK